MSYKITIICPDNKLPAMLKELNRTVEVEYVEDCMKFRVKATEPAWSTPSKHLSIGKKTPRPGTNLAKIVTLVKKLEGKHGAHQVTHVQLRHALRDEKYPEYLSKSGITAAIRQGYLEKS